MADRISSSKFFISYSRKDKLFAESLQKGLQNRQYEIWIDWKNIPVSVSWLEEIYNAIERSDIFLFIISADSVSSDMCKLELSQAIKLNKRIVPILFKDVSNDKIPEELKSIQWLTVSGDVLDESHIDSLLEIIALDIDWVHFHTRLLTRAKDWDRRYRNKSLLLHGKDLIETEKVVLESKNKMPKINEIQKDFLLESRKAARVAPGRGASFFAITSFVSLIFIALNIPNNYMESISGGVQTEIVNILILGSFGALSVIPFRLPFYSVIFFLLCRIFWFEALLYSTAYSLGASNHFDQFGSITRNFFSIDVWKDEWINNERPIEPYKIIILAGIISIVCLITAAIFSRFFTKVAAMGSWLIAFCVAIFSTGIIPYAAQNITSDAAQIYFYVGDIIGWSIIGALLGVFSLRKQSK